MLEKQPVTIRNECYRAALLCDPVRFELMRGDMKTCYKSISLSSHLVHTLASEVSEQKRTKRASTR